MQIIAHKTGKELRSRHYSELKELEIEYQKIGAQTYLTELGRCERLWTLLVFDQNPYPNQMSRYNP